MLFKKQTTNKHPDWPTLFSKSLLLQYNNFFCLSVTMATDPPCFQTNFQYSISTREVTREDFMMVLANIDSLRIRAQYFDRILSAE